MVACPSRGCFNLQPNQLCVAACALFVQLLVMCPAAACAGSPAAAEAFLVALAEGCREQADEELAGLTALKRTHTGNTSQHSTTPLTLL
jgi:hypothetical protein